MATKFGSLWDGIRKVADISSHLHTLSAVFGAFNGHEVDKDAPAVAKGVSGIFGLRDEREWLKLLNLANRRVPGSAQVISEFVRWHFRFGEVEPSLAVRAYITLRSNQFRSVIIDMAHSDGSGSGDAVHVVDSKLADGSTVKSTITKKIRDEGDHAGVDLLVQMYNIITSTGKQRLRGQRKCLDYLRSAGVPVLNERTIEQLRAAPERFLNALRAVSPRVLEFYQNQRERVVRSYDEVSDYIGRQANSLEAFNTRREENLPLRNRLVRGIFRT